MSMKKYTAYVGDAYTDRIYSMRELSNDLPEWVYAESPKEAFDILTDCFEEYMEEYYNTGMMHHDKQGWWVDFPDDTDDEGGELVFSDSFNVDEWEEYD